MALDPSLFKGVLDKLCEGVRFVDMEGTVTFWNKGAELITGYAAKDMAGGRCDALRIVFEDEQTNACSHICPLSSNMKSDDVFEQKVYVRHRDGHLVPVLMSVSRLMDEGGQCTGIAEMFHDISWKTRALDRIAELKELSLADPLTLAGNRRHGERTIHGKVEELKRFGTKFGIAVVDVDNFKRVNDTFGHNTGDRLLQAIAKSLSATLRPFDTVCRWGGDEFVVIASNLRNEKDMMSLANRLRLLVEETVFENPGPKGGIVSATVSIGAALAHHGEEAVDLVERVDGLMYQSKSLGKNIVTLGKYQE